MLKLPPPTIKNRILIYMIVLLCLILLFYFIILLALHCIMISIYNSISIRNCHIIFCIIAVYCIVHIHYDYSFVLLFEVFYLVFELHFSLALFMRFHHLTVCPGE